MRPSPSGHNVRKTAYKQVVLQAVAVVIVALAWSFSSGLAAMSVLLGGFCYVVPNALLVWVLFRQPTASGAKRFIVVFYIGELLKLVITGVLAVLILGMMKVAALPFFIGLAVALVSIWLAPALGLYK